MKSAICLAFLLLALGPSTLPKIPSLLPPIHIEQPPSQQYLLDFGADQIAIAPLAPILDLGADYTMESWVYLESPSPYGIIMGETHNPGNVDPYIGFVLSLTDSGDKVQFVQTTGKPGSYRSATSGFNIPLRVWTHVAATLSGSVMRLLINGTLAATNTSLGPSNEQNVSFAIGNGATPNGGIGCCGVVGSIRHTSVWNRALTDSEIASSPSHYLAGNEPGLVAYWPMDDGRGQTIRDLGPNALNLQRGTTPTIDPADPKWIHDSILENPPYTFQRFQLPAQYSKYANYLADGTLIDFDSDGYPDTLIALYNPPSTPGPLLAFQNDHHGGFIDATAKVLGDQNIQFVNPRDFAVADFNHDGRMDVFIADHGPDAPPFPGGQSRLLIQTPDGRLVDETSSRMPGLQNAFTHTVAAGDVNGDGSIDLYVGNIGDEHHNGPNLYLNDGTGHFTACYTCLPAALSNLDQKYTSARFVDVNKNGRLDLVLGGMPGTGLTKDAILLNDGKGHFSFAPDTAMPSRYGGSGWGTVNIAVGDLKGDGWPDLLMATTGGGTTNYHDSRVQLLINNRDGTYSDASDQVPQTFMPQISSTGDRWVKWIKSVDWNRNGQMGFVTSGVGLESHAYLNQGVGRFEDISEILPNLPDTFCCYVILPGDLNNTGHTDLFVLGEGFYGIARYHRPVDPSLFQTTSVTISEVQLNPGVTGQWLQLHNTGNRQVDITGWMLQDGEAAVTVSLGKKVLLQNENFTEALTGQGFSSKGDRFILFDTDGRQIDATPLLDNSQGDCGIWRLDGTRWRLDGCPNANAMLSIPTFVLTGGLFLTGVVVTLTIFHLRRRKRSK